MLINKFLFSRVVGYAPIAFTDLHQSAHPIVFVNVVILTACYPHGPTTFLTNVLLL